MMRHWLAPAVLCACAVVASGQSFEASASFGRSVFPGNSKYLGTTSTDPQDTKYTMNDGFAMALRMTLNSWRFFGVEFGYGYNHTSIGIPSSTVTGIGGISQTLPAQTISLPTHQGFGDFLVYATPEGSHIRPFAAGGVHFSSYFPPGSNTYYGSQTKFGYNYGAGLKVRVTEVWGLRFDGRYYENGKPFSFPNQSGLLRQLQITGGISFNL